MIIKEWNRGSAYDLRLPACTALPLPFVGAARIRSSPESSFSLFTAGAGAFFSSGSGSFAISMSELDSLISKKGCVAFLVVTGAARFFPGGSSSSSPSWRPNPSSNVDALVVDMESTSSPESSSPRRRPQSSWLARSLCRGVPARGFGCNFPRQRGRLHRRHCSFRASRASMIDAKAMQEAMIHNAAATTTATSCSSCSSCSCSSSSSSYISALLKMKGSMRAST
ncbi:hypothetical protein EDB92DRAFT_1831879 [Lactarius akahatsu]|uniref:Uncharacterized protein n=1 Tax=Lactarius akahatsu TaxID=416441 RepID=A0AAD4LP15_9AGAM|nr:hypothetical protein EDB92DRAFT_1831879 [Lactarius akahatsu]